MVPPGLRAPGGLGGLDHAQGDAVLHGPTGVHVLDLGQHRGGDALGDDVELDEGRVPDEVGDVFGILHRPIVSDSGQRRRPRHVPGARAPAGRARRYRGVATPRRGCRLARRRGSFHGQGSTGDTDRGDRGVRRRRPGRRPRRARAAPATACSRSRPRWPAGSSAGRSRAPPTTTPCTAPGCGEPIELVVLGDSSAAGMGADTPWQTVGAIIANGVSALSGRPVRLTNVAVIGAESSALDVQLANALAEVPGAGRGRHHDRRQRRDAPDRQVGRPCATWPRRCARCATSAPRWSSAPAPTWARSSRCAQPLRLLARRWSRDLAAAQTVAVVEAGGRTVSLGDLLGPEFYERPHEMFSSDRFHPSPAGYARAAAALLPSVCAALGIWVGEGEAAPDRRRGEGVEPVAVAAVQAVRDPGTEVSADRGRRAGARSARAAGPSCAGGRTSPSPTAASWCWRRVERPASGARAPGRRRSAGSSRPRGRGRRRRPARTTDETQPTRARTWRRNNIDGGSATKRLLTRRSPGGTVPEAVIVSTARSPIGRAFKGSLKDVRPDDLAAAVVTAALEKIPALDPTLVDDLYLGLRRAVGRARLQHGPRGGRAGRLRPPARAPPSTASAPRRCRPPGWRSTRSAPARATSSSAPASRRCPATSTSPAPAGPRPTGRTRRFAEARRPQRPDGGGQHGLDRPREDGQLPDIYLAMGQTAENVAGLRGVSRERQDEWGVSSQNRAEKAIADGFFAREITPDHHARRHASSAPTTAPARG